MTEGKTHALQFVLLREPHLHEVMAIECEAYPEPWTEGMFRQEIQSAASYFYVVFLEEILIGYVGFWFVADEAHITSVTVRYDHRGRGYGRQELEFILDEAARVGARLATLEVRASNFQAQRLYNRAGFQQTGRRKGYYSRTKEDALIMTKELIPNL